MGTHSPWRIIGEAAAIMAAGMGVGRFVYTPILPMMIAQAGLSAAGGAAIATANYIGYLVGAGLAIAMPGVIRSRLVLRLALVLLVVTLALMPTTHSIVLWSVFRLLAGFASALLGMISVASLLSHLLEQGSRLAGWGWGGIGVGIALSGLLVLGLRQTSSWAMAWVSATVLAAVLAAVGWNLLPERTPLALSEHRPPAQRTRRWFTAVVISYTLEGVGYIIAGTFLVAAIDENAPSWVGSGSWILVGLAAVPAAALCGWLSTRVSLPTLLLLALVIQAVGISLPAISSGIAPALISAVLFGVTFMGASALALAIGSHLRFPRAVAILTTAYGVGQILGPLVVAPFLADGYRTALLISAAVIAAAAVAAAALRVRFPSRHDADRWQQGLEAEAQQNEGL